MLKKLFIGLTLISCIFALSNICLAANVINNVTNATENVGNAVSNTLQNTGNAVKNAVENTGNAANNTMNNVQNGTRNALDNTINAAGTANNTIRSTNTGYTATRTATSNVFTRSNLWTWLIVGAIVLVLIGFIAYYVMSDRRAHDRY